MPKRRRRISNFGPGSKAITAGRQYAQSSTSPDSGIVVALHLSPDGQYLAVGTGDNRLAVYRLQGERLGEQLGEWEANVDRKVTWSDSGHLLALVNTRGDVGVIHLPSGRSSIVSGPATAVAFYPDGSRLALVYESSLRIHEFSSQSYTNTVELPHGRENEGVEDTRFLLSVSPDSRWLACSTETATIQILDPVWHGVAHEFVAHQDIITDLEWISPNLLVTASADESIRLWDIDQRRELRVLEVGEPVVGVTYAPHWHCVIGWTPNTYLFWAVSTGQIMWQGPLATGATLGSRNIAAFRHRALLVTLNGPAITDIRFSSGWDASLGSQPGVVSTYTNAKVLLLGDSGVGKSGLALVLAGEKFHPTESTHARRIWRMQAPELNDGEQAKREILIWDLAGQPGYRIVHQLHLSDAAAALILFDSTSETRPLEGVSYWARALQHTKTLNAHSNEALTTFLVAARADRSVVNVSNERIAEVVNEFGFRAFLSTSALEGWGIAELRREVLAAIDWARIPVITSSTLFAAAKSFVLDQKAAGTLLTPLAALHAAFAKAPVTGPAAEAAPDARVGGDLLGVELDLGKDHQERLRRVFEVCVARLESAGLVKRLAFGDLILLQPELIDVYAGAIVNAARDEPDGLGNILESDVLTVNFKFPQKERIDDSRQEKLLVIATLEELTRHEIVLREETEDGVQLIFPAEFRRDLPDLAAPLGNVLQFAFEGPVDNVYATLIVRLTRSDRFTRRGSWKSAAQFHADSGGMCTLQLVRLGEGRGALHLSYSEDVAEVVRFQFERFVMAHLERRTIPGTVRRTRQYRCPSCNSSFTAEQIEAARRLGRTDLVCPADEMRVPLEALVWAPSGTQDAVTREMDSSADAARNVAAASSIILGKQETTDFDVFLCHNAVDKPAVRWTAQRLRENGILPWLDEAELPPGRPWQEELERQITRIRTAAVFVGPSGIGPWQSQEMRAFLSEFAKRGCPVIPVMLPGATPPELPVFLRSMTWVDLSAQDVAGIERLIWGITGRRPTRPGPGQGPAGDSA
jgi:GTPase SAR1 family protein